MIEEKAATLKAKGKKHIAVTGGAAHMSLVLGVLSCCCVLGPVTGIPAIIYGHVAQFRLRKYGGLRREKASARLGLILGYFSLVFSLVVWGFVIWNSSSPLAEKIKSEAWQSLSLPVRPRYGFRSP